MTQVRLIQVGDVHFPEAQGQPVSDLKDSAFPLRIAEVAQYTPLQAVMRNLLRQVDDRCDGVLVCGDLTSFGNLPAYASCLRYLGPVLDRFPPDHLHAVPGNHDIDRTRASLAAGSLSDKFAPFREAWRDLGLPVLTVEPFRTTEITSKSGAKVRVFSVNSCLGCGERRHLPPAICDQLEELLRRHVEAEGLEKAFPLIGETLDTPTFAGSDIEAVCGAISDLDSHVVPFVLAHHNLLPQAFLRIAMYAEAINAGLFRSRLTRLRRSVLYCHGHVHADPLETVSQSTPTGMELVCVSAPRFTEGFNVLTVEFGTRGLPLGCTISRHRLDLSDGSFSTTDTRLPFHRPEVDTIRRVGHDDLLALIGVLHHDFMRFSDALERLSKALDRRVRKQTLELLLREAEWLGCVRLNNAEQSSDHWHVRRITA